MEYKQWLTIRNCWFTSEFLLFILESVSWNEYGSTLEGIINRKHGGKKRVYMIGKVLVPISFVVF